MIQLARGYHDFRAAEGGASVEVDLLILLEVLVVMTSSEEQLTTNLHGSSWFA